MSPKIIAISNSEVTISDRRITRVFPVLSNTLETRIFGVEVRDQCSQSIQLTFLTGNLRAVSIMECGNRRDLFLEIGYPLLLLIASRGILVLRRAGVPEVPYQLEL